MKNNISNKKYNKYNKNSKNDKYKTILICFIFIILFIIICYYIKKNKEYKETNTISTFMNADSTLVIPKYTIGFFACCADILKHIIDYFNINKKLPLNIDTSQQFSIYKPSYIQGDIMPYFFEKKDNIDITYINTIKLVNNFHSLQYERYKDMDYTQFTPFIEKYFSPSQEIIDIENQIINKYNINVNEYCAIYFRGTDKKEETEIGSFDTYIEKMNELLNIDKNIKFIIQSDNTYFIDEIKSKFSNSISFDENVSSTSDKGIHNENSPDDNYIIMKNFLAIVYIISKCKYIICSSGNCSFWMMLFRGNGLNVNQYFNNQWY